MWVFNNTMEATRYLIETAMREDVAVEHDNHVTFILNSRTFEVDYIDLEDRTLDDAAAAAAAGELGCEANPAPLAATAEAAIRLLDRVAPAVWGDDPVEEAAVAARCALYATIPTEWGALFCGPVQAGRWYKWDGGRASPVPTWDVPLINDEDWAKAAGLSHVPVGDTVFVQKRYRPLDGDRIVQILDGVATPFIYRAP